jgi:hypothetical protein
VKSRERLFVWECECYRPAGEVNERERGVGGMESVSAPDDELHLVVLRLGPGVAQAQASGGEDALAVFADRSAEPDERFQAAAGETAQQPVDQLGDGVDGEAWGEDRSDHLLHRPGARDLPAAGADRSKRGGLLVGEIVRVAQERPAVVLELLGGAGLAGVAQLVPALATNLVQRLRGRAARRGSCRCR